MILCTPLSKIRGWEGGGWCEPLAVMLGSWRLGTRGSPGTPRPPPLLVYYCGQGALLGPPCWGRRSQISSEIADLGVCRRRSKRHTTTPTLRNSILNPQIWRFDYGSLVCTRETPAFDEDRVPSHHAQHPLLSDGAVRSPWGNA